MSHLHFLSERHDIKSDKCESAVVAGWPVSGAVLLPGAKDFHCHVEEKDTADVPLVHPLHHCCSESQTGDSSFPMYSAFGQDGDFLERGNGECTMISSNR